jgi:hypothetical protein
MDVEHRWLAHQPHIHWRTGLPTDSGEDIAAAETNGHYKHTHCSAFAAAVGDRLGIYLLHPPEHKQLLLANAQSEWLPSAEGKAAGWHHIHHMRVAQEHANQGEFVVLAYANPNAERPGHIVVVRPSLKSEAALEAEGPQIIQAGLQNSVSEPAVRGFVAHPGAWPDGVRAYAHAATA